MREVMKKRNKEVATEEVASWRVPKWEEYPHTLVFSQEWQIKDFRDTEL